MTIDEAVDSLVESKYSYESPSSDTIDVAIATMRKYQKIKKILDTNVVYSDSDFMMLSAIKRVIDGDMQEDKSWKFIDEVVEDGKIGRCR